MNIMSTIIISIVISIIFYDTFEINNPALFWFIGSITGMIINNIYKRK